MENYYPEQLSGDQTKILLTNPDRGFRFEVYLDVKTGKSIYEYAKEDAISALKREASLYTDDQPQIVQVYFYLTGYQHAPLDAQAFDHMSAFFEELAKLNLKALLRFAYISEDKRPYRQAPSLQRIQQHLEQLSGWLQEHRQQIHALQAGIIGPWGEWSAHARETTDESAILHSLLLNSPQDLTVQVRYLNIKNRNIGAAEKENEQRIGFHDDFLIGIGHEWNTAGKNYDSNEYQQLIRDSKKTIVDGESIWLFANPMYLKTKYVDPELTTQRMVENHFTTLSIAHNYHEIKTNSYYNVTLENELKRTGKPEGLKFPQMGSFEYWKHVPVTPDLLDKKNWPYQKSWFLNQKNQTIERNYFEYLRDYLGYRLEVKQISYNSTLNAAVYLTLKNTGFAAPLALQKIELFAADQQQNIIGKAFVEKSALQTNREVTTVIPLTKSEQPDKVGVKLLATNGSTARLANECQWADGINWFKL
ncbi:hypothetical protein DKL56_00140 [Lactobacillus apis]|uniref:DUF4874 domain-containing protein n=1 Tax=Lactobacillus apis TaxID=303541 RepID=UPI000D6D412B|nr:DUF4874 domain-containing protein [Lactobacillus apis]AWM73028.1 hypothetical protein DKL56_00140 [Lactobacillus apis]